MLINLSSVLSDTMSPAALAITQFPWWTQDLEKLKRLQVIYNNTIQYIGDQNDIPVLDVNTVINNLGVEKEKLFFDAFHVYCEGNTIIADQLHNLLQSKKWLPK